MEAFFDLIAPAVNALVDFVGRFWPSLLLMAGAFLLARSGRRAPRISAPSPRIAYAIVFALSLVTGILTFAFRGEPMHDYADDFGYLLTADTFLHGRLTNPPLPLSAHFDSLYALQRPTYAAVYLPGNGLVLALGRLLSGRDIVGMQIATMLAAVALFWALRGWISDGWAFLVGCLAAVHPTLAAWSNSLHGGALTAFGGALMAGAVGRLRREPKVIDGVAFGAGAVLLAWTRLYEGFVVAAALTILLFVFRRRGLSKPAAAALIVIAAGVGFLMYFDVRVTGHPLKTPYVAYNERYLSAPNFIWERAGIMPRYDHPDFAFIYRHFRSYYFRNRVPAEFLRTVYAETVAHLCTAIPRVRTGAGDSLWLLEILPFAAFLLAAFRDRAAAAIAAALAVAWLSLLAITWFTQPHYAAPSAGLFAVAIGIGFMTLDRWPFGEWLARAAYVAMLVVALIAMISSWRPNGVSDRTRMAETMTRRSGPHLVLVSENCYFYVFNGAEIDAQRIVWARDLGDNADLLRYYADRSVWSVRCGGGDRLAFVRAPLRASVRQAFENYP